MGFRDDCSVLARVRALCAARSPWYAIEAWLVSTRMQSTDTRADGTFPLGRTVATRGAAVTLTADDILLALSRHSAGDWGELDRMDKARNDIALASEGRLFSAYLSASGIRFYVITECDRSATTILLPSEY